MSPGKRRLPNRAAAFLRKYLPFPAPSGILKERIFPDFSKMEDEKMKGKIAAALFCAGLLAFGPMSGVPATLPGGVRS